MAMALEPGSAAAFIRPEARTFQAIAFEVKGLDSEFNLKNRIDGSLSVIRKAYRQASRGFLPRV